MSHSYPIHLNLANRLCVVIGGGSVAVRKVRGLLESGAVVRVVSPSFMPELETLGNLGEIELVRTIYSPANLTGAFLIFAATDRADVNAEVVSCANNLRILVNSADDPEAGGFVTPSVVRRGKLCLSVTTGGASPTLAAKISGELETRFGAEYAPYLELLSRARTQIQAKIASPSERRRLLGALLDLELELLELLRNGNTEEAERLLTAKIG